MTVTVMSSAARFTCVEGVPWPLLPCELDLVPALRVLAKGDGAAALVGVLRAHPFVAVSEGVSDLGVDVGGTVSATHFRINISAFRKWLKTLEGAPFAKEAGGPSDDGVYTISAVLRRALPRGLSHFTFDATGEDVLIRGFRKFTGLAVSDEDEESGATGRKESFFFTDASAERFAVTTKSNGENGKFAVRSVGGKRVLFAGSKNTCLAWGEGADVSALHPPHSDGSVPGPVIAAGVHALWEKMSDAARARFEEKLGRCTCMLEINMAGHEHVFPIETDHLEFVAVLDEAGLPLPQREAFALLDEFGLPRVRCEPDLPMSALAARLAEERAATDREGAVLYLETREGRPVGLLKVKSDFYVKARRTRQIFWRTLVDPMSRRKPREPAKAPGWETAEQRLRAGMRTLHHVQGCAEHSEAWAAEAVGFVRWWRARLEAAADEAAVLLEARNKFGSLYRDYCSEVGLLSLS